MNLLEGFDDLLDVFLVYKFIRGRGSEQLSERVFYLIRKPCLSIVLTNIFLNLIVLIKAVTCYSITMLYRSRDQIIFTKSCIRLALNRSQYTVSSNFEV